MTTPNKDMTSPKKMGLADAFQRWENWLDNRRIVADEKLTLAPDGTRTSISYSNILWLSVALLVVPLLFVPGATQDAVRDAADPFWGMVVVCVVSVVAVFVLLKIGLVYVQSVPWSGYAARTVRCPEPLVGHVGETLTALRTLPPSQERNSLIVKIEDELKKLPAPAHRECSADELFAATNRLDDINNEIVHLQITDR